MSPFRPTKQHKAILAAMAPAGRSSFEPVQIQKLLFLIDRELGDYLGGPKFNFEPYNYGPFDKQVYNCLGEMSQEGLVESVPVRNQHWSMFCLAAEGQTLGEQELQAYPEWARQTIQTYVKWILSLSFADLVSAIYNKYPDMKSNSVFDS